MLDDLLRKARKRRKQQEKRAEETEELQQQQARVAAQEAAALEVQDVPTGAAPLHGQGLDGSEPGDARLKSIFTATPRVPPPRPLVHSDTNDQMLQRLEGHLVSAKEAHVLIHDGWLATHFSKVGAPTALLQWLFASACYGAPSLSAASARALREIFTSARAAPKWVPSSRDFADALVRLGADPSHLLGEDEPLAAEAEPEPPAEGAEEAEEFDLRWNLLNLLELAPSCCPHWRPLPKAEWLLALRWMWRLLIEPHALPALPQLQETLAKLLEMPNKPPTAASDQPPTARSDDPPGASSGTRPAAGLGPQPTAASDDPSPADSGEFSWSRMQPLTSTLTSLSARLPHAQLVQLCQQLPATARGLALRQAAALAAMTQLLRRRQGGAAASPPRKESAAASSGGALALSLAALLGAVECVRWAEQIGELHSFVLLADLAISADPGALRAVDKPPIEALRNAVSILKQGVSRHRANLDYDGMELESYLIFLQSKLNQLFIAELC